MLFVASSGRNYHWHNAVFMIYHGNSVTSLLHSIHHAYKTKVKLRKCYLIQLRQLIIYSPTNVWVPRTERNPHGRAYVHDNGRLWCENCNGPDQSGMNCTKSRNSSTTAQEIQQNFYKRLTKHYSKYVNSTTIKSKNRLMISEKAKNFGRWWKHYRTKRKCFGYIVRLRAFRHLLALNIFKMV